jgi:hypothetical protein
MKVLAWTRSGQINIYAVRLFSAKFRILVLAGNVKFSTHVEQ